MSEHPLDRTALLLQRDVFEGIARAVAIDALMRTRVRLTADPETMQTPGGQTAVIASFVVLAQMGLRVSLDIPDTETIGFQPPLERGPVREQLAGLATRLVQPCGVSGDQEELVVAIGAGPGGRDAIRVTGTDWSATVRRGGQGAAWTGSLPFGGVLAAVPVGAVALARVVQRLEAELGVAAPATFRRVPLPADVMLPPLPTTVRDVGDIDVISAGAITNAALFALLRWPAIRGRLRVFDADVAEITNLNRYLLLDRRAVGIAKVRWLERLDTGDLDISGIAQRFDACPAQLPLASRVLVGVDHIPSRWLVQGAAAGWVHVAATSHFEVMSSGHEHGEPCAGCAHPRDADPDDGEIPTISFVSLLAGTLQAYSLLSHVAGKRVPNWFCWPMNLGGPAGMQPIDPGPNRACPLRCPASLA